MYYFTFQKPTEEQLEEFRESQEYCSRNHYHTFADYLLCFFVRTRILDQDNNLDKAKLKICLVGEFLGHIYTDDEGTLMSIIDKCAVQQESPRTTAVFVYRCIRGLVRRFKIKPVPL